MFRKRLEYGKRYWLSTAGISLAILNGNRVTTEDGRKLARLRSSLMQSGIKLPLVVAFCKRDGVYYIADGQHRHYLAGLLGIDVPFYIEGEYETQADIIKFARDLNTGRVPSWTAADYVRAEVATGNESYRQLDDFIRETGKSLSVAITLASGRYYSGKEGTNLANGTLPFSCNGKAHAANLLMDDLGERCPIVPIIFAWACRAFIDAGLSAHRLLEGAKGMRARKVKIRTKTDAAHFFEDLYNKTASDDCKVPVASLMKGLDKSHE